MDPKQFQKNLLSMQDYMLNFALTLTSNKEDAQDLLQETTLKALDNQDMYMDDVNFKGWVLTIMRNIFINNYHKVVRTHTVIDQNADLYNLDVTNKSGFDSPDSSFQLKEISYAIECLNDDLRIPFSLFVSGYKYNEIAEHLKLPLGTVKSRIFFARAELKNSLKELSPGH